MKGLTMTKSKQNRKNKSKKNKENKGAASSSSLLRGKSQGLSIGEFNINCISVFRDFECFAGLIKAACGLFVILGILVQIRFAKNNIPPALVDRLPSYKFYKSRYLKSFATHGVVISLGMHAILPWLDPDPMALESALFANLDAGVGSNAAYIDKPNSQNYVMYYYGVVSRMLGLLNSCPATNHQVFNFPSSIKDADIETVLKWMPFAEEDKPSVEELIDFLRQTILRSDESPAFQEDSLPGETGLTPLEFQVFGDVMSRNAPVSNRLDRGSVLPGNAITRDLVVSVLSPLELAQYDLSAKSNPSRLKELSKIAVERVNARSAQRTQQISKSAPPAGSSSPADQPSVSASEVEGASNPGAAPIPAAPPAKKKPGRPKKSDVAAAAFKGLPLPPTNLPNALAPPAQGPSFTAPVSEQKKGSSPPEAVGSALHGAESKQSSPSPETQDQLGQPATPSSGGSGSPDAGSPESPSPSPSSSLAA